MDPVTKIQIDELNSLYTALQERLASLQSELFSVGVEMGALQEKLVDANVIPRTFNDKVRGASLGLKPRPFGPIKPRSGGITGIFPHPVDGVFAIDSEPAGGG